MNDDPLVTITDPETEKNILEFWVAYLEGPEGKKHYLNNTDGDDVEGKEKGLRLFKTKGAVETYLDELLEAGRISDVARAAIVIHPLQGMIALPDEVHQMQPPIHLPRAEQIPIRTLAPNTVPTASEQLNTLIKKRRRRK